MLMALLGIGGYAAAVAGRLERARRVESFLSDPFGSFSHRLGTAELETELRPICRGGSDPPCPRFGSKVFNDCERRGNAVFAIGIRAVFPEQYGMISTGPPDRLQNDVMVDMVARGTMAQRKYPAVPL